MALKNRYPGRCYLCAKAIGVNNGKMEKFEGQLRLFCRDCIYPVLFSKMAKAKKRR